MDGQNELSKLKDIVKLNLGRALLPDTHTMLFMRFIANDGQENLLWSLSFDTEKVRARYGELPAASSNETVVQELIKRMQVLKTSPGTVHFFLFQSDWRSLFLKRVFYFRHAELSRMLSLTPVDNLMLPTETLTLSPSTIDAHIRPNSLPHTHHRVLLLGKYCLPFTTILSRF